MSNTYETVCGIDVCFKFHSEEQKELPIKCKIHVGIENEVPMEIELRKHFIHEGYILYSNYDLSICDVEFNPSSFYAMVEDNRYGGGSWYRFEYMYDYVSQIKHSWQLMGLKEPVLKCDSVHKCSIYVWCREDDAWEKCASTVYCKNVTRPGLD